MFHRREQTIVRIVRVHMNVVPHSTRTQMVKQRINSEVATVAAEVSEGDKANLRVIT